MSENYAKTIHSELALFLVVYKKKVIALRKATKTLAELASGMSRPAHAWLAPAGSKPLQAGFYGSFLK